MQIEVNKNVSKLVDNSEECYIAGSINYFLIRFAFSEEWEELTKKIIYIKANTIIEETILDNTTVIPKMESGTYKVGIVGFKEENNIKTKQISTNFIYVKFADGAGEYVANTELTEQETTTFEYYLKQITNVSNKIDSDIEIIRGLKTEVITKQEEFSKYAELKEKNINEIYESSVKVKEDIEADMKEFSTTVENATTNFNSNANTKTTEFNKNSTEKTEDYNTNAETKKQEINAIANGVKDMATAIQFATFEVTDNMELVINTADKLANTNFSFNEETGELEVEIND